MKTINFLLGCALLLAATGAGAGDEKADETTKTDIWTRETAVPLLTPSGDPTRFDCDYVCEPRIVYDDETKTYFMFYAGGVEIDRPNREAIGLATATKLSGPWTKYEGPNDRCALLVPGKEGDYDFDRNWGQGTILKAGPRSWKMWTVGDSDPSPAHVPRVGYATSEDGYHWTKYKGSNYGGAILEDASEGPGIITIAVIKEDDGYHAWYYLYSTGTVKYATSPDGIDWTVRCKVLDDPKTIVAIDNVVKVGDAYYMGTTRPDLQGADLYTSTNKTDWRRLDRYALRPSPKGWDSARVYYPFLFPVSATEWCVFYTGADVQDDLQGKIGFARAPLPNGR